MLYNTTYHIPQATKTQKVALVTGGTAGIGKATAIGIAQLGYRVWVTGRDEKRARKAVKEIKEASENPDVHFIASDLSYAMGVRMFADDLKDRIDRLDILVNNIGGIFPEKTLNEDGHDMAFFMNHLSSVILNQELERILSVTPYSRVVHVNSGIYHFGRLRRSDMQFDNYYQPLEAYASAKLYNVLYAVEQARRWQPLGINLNVAAPGVADTDQHLLVKQNPWVLPMPLRLFSPLMRIMPVCSTEKAARSVIFLATSPGIEDMSGKYFSPHVKSVRIPRCFTSKENIAFVWDYSEQISAWQPSVYNTVS